MFSHAKWTALEVASSAYRERGRPHPIPEDAGPAGPAQRRRHDPPDLGGDLAKQLLVLGEYVWDTLCREGVLDPSFWTADQRVTILGMMAGLSVDDIATLRGERVPGRTSTPSLGSTREMMRKVREKGKVLLWSMPDEQRRLLGYRYEDLESSREG